MIKSWSFSSLMTYERCPYAARLKHIDRVPEPPPAPDSPLLRGTLFHESIESHLKTGAPLIPELASWKSRLDEIQATPGIQVIEDEWGFDLDWNPVDWRGATCRMKLDLAFIGDETARIIDWKTGKAQGNEIKHSMQGQLYAIGCLARHPELRSIKAEFHYLDFPDSNPLAATYRPDQIVRFRDAYNRRAAKMLSDEELRPIPSKSNCRFCSYNQACQYAVTP